MLLTRMSENRSDLKFVTAPLMKHMLTIEYDELDDAKTRAKEIPEISAEGAAWLAIVVSAGADKEEES